MSLHHNTTEHTIILNTAFIITFSFVFHLHQKLSKAKLKKKTTSKVRQHHFYWL